MYYNKNEDRLISNKKNLEETTINNHRNHKGRFMF